MATSELTNDQYWKDVYANEYNNLETLGCEGEEWYESETDSIIDFVADLVESKSSSILDVGCGNGLFLLRLASNF